VLFALDGVLGLAVLALWLFCIFDAITAEPTLVRNLPKGLWIVLVIVLFDVGAIMWLIAGRPRAEGRPGGLPYKGNTGRPHTGASRHSPVRDGPVAPDDDPEFLAQLDRDTLRAWEDDLRRREQRLRDADEPPADERP
jgi:hypothetical protein